MLKFSYSDFLQSSFEWFVLIKAFILSIVLAYIIFFLLILIGLGLMYVPVSMPSSWFENDGRVFGEAVAFFVYAVSYSMTFFYVARSVHHNLRHHFIALAGMIFVYVFVFDGPFDTLDERWIYALQTIVLLLASMAAGYGLSRLKR